jgi:hypothetical protein
MMMSTALAVVLLVAGAVLAGAAALGVTHQRVQLTPLALALGLAAAALRLWPP